MENSSSRNNPNTIKVRLGAIVGIGTVVCLLLAVLTAVACGDKNKMDNKDKDDQTAKHNRRIRLRGIFPYDAKEHTLRTDVVNFDTNEIHYFAILGLEAKDQTSGTCAFDGTSVGIIKGGVNVTVYSKIDPDVAERVIVKMKIMINEDVIDVVCGYRKRTPAERAALNPDVEWTYLDELKEVKVSQAEGR